MRYAFRFVAFQFVCPNTCKLCPADRHALGHHGTRRGTHTGATRPKTFEALAFITVEKPKKMIA